MTSSKIALSLVTVAVAATMLSGCSAIAAVHNAQTKAQACKSIASELTAVGNGISGLSGEIAKDPKAGAKDIASISSKFSGQVAKLENPTVKKAGTQAADSLATFSKDFTAFADKPGTDTQKTMESDATSLSTNFSDIESACKP